MQNPYMNNQYNPYYNPYMNNPYMYLNSFNSFENPNYYANNKFYNPYMYIKKNPYDCDDIHIKRNPFENEDNNQNKYINPIKNPKIKSENSNYSDNNNNANLISSKNLDNLEEMTEPYKSKNEKKKRYRDIKENNKIKKSEFNCIKCNSDFDTLEQFLKHLKEQCWTPFDESNFNCLYCGKRYKNNYNLKRHLMKHTGIYRFTCPVCGKGFTENCKLRKHFEIHIRTPIKCEFCKYTFQNNVTLDVHLQKFHPNEVPPPKEKMHFYEI